MCTSIDCFMCDMILYRCLCIIGMVFTFIVNFYTHTVLIFCYLLIGSYTSHECLHVISKIWGGLSPPCPPLVYTLVSTTGQLLSNILYGCFEKPSATFCNTYSRTVQYNQIPIPGRTEKVYWVFVSATSPSYNCHGNSTGMHTSQSRDLLWIINSRRVSCWYTVRTLLLDLCEQERSQQFGHFDCSVLNFNCFMPHFVLSMQRVFWTVLLIIHLQITCG